MYYDLTESGMRIKELRKKAGLTQEGLAEAVGVSIETIGKLERGARGASIEVLDDIAACLGSNIEYLAFGRVNNISIVGIEIPEDKMEMVVKVLRAIVE